MDRAAQLFRGRYGREPRPGELDSLTLGTRGSKSAAPSTDVSAAWRALGSEHNQTAQRSEELLVLFRYRHNTNNAAERAVRRAVLMRKLQGGTQSEEGSRWIERIQSVRETCRLQGRPVLGWLTQAATAAHHGRPIPTLLPAAAQGP